MPNAHNFKRTLRSMIEFSGGPEHVFSTIRTFLQSAYREEPLSTIEVQVLCRGAAELCRAETPSALRYAMKNIADVLRSMAVQGDADARDALVRAAVHLADLVKECSLAEPERFKGLARKSLEWPTTISIHPDWTRDNEELTKELELGADSWIQTQVEYTKYAAPKQPHRGIAHVYCYRLVELVEVLMEYRDYLDVELSVAGRPIEEITLDPPRLDVAFKALASLRPLSADTAQQWFDLGWEVMMFVTENRPEDLPGLKAIGLPRENHNLGRKGDDPSEATRLWNIRDGIETALNSKFLLRFKR